MDESLLTDDDLDHDNNWFGVETEATLKINLIDEMIAALENK